MLWQRIIGQVKNSSPFFEWMYAYIFFGGFFLLLIPKAYIHLFINHYHSSAADIFFTYATVLGDGISASLLVVIFLFIRFRYAAMLAVSNIACAVIIQSLKRLFFSDAVRPIQFFKGIHPLYLVPGVDIYSFNSFPSGHSATIFTTCTLLCMMTNQRPLRTALFILAFTVAFSRVYLSEHFFADIYAGAIIGVLVAYSTAAYFNKSNDSPGWFGQSITTLLKR